MPTRRPFHRVWIWIAIAIAIATIFTIASGEIHRAKGIKRPWVEIEPVKKDADDGGSLLVNVAQFFLRNQVWFCSIFAAAIVGLSGVFPLLIISVDAGKNIHDKDGGRTLRLLLGFAVGGLMGDVFLHLLPEAWKHSNSGKEDSMSSTEVGLWVLAGIFSFVVIQMMSEIGDDKATQNKTHDTKVVQPQNKVNGSVTHPKKTDNNNIVSNGVCDSHKGSDNRPKKNVAGYLNLLANSIDNFTHGLAVAGSFLVSFKVGALTTMAILLHEIPHEIGDFAILLKSGFTRVEAAKAQISTATIGIAGALAALSANSAESLGDRTAWILPFTAGGFINIAMVNVLPEILKEDCPKESAKQLASILTGVAIMWLVTVLFE